MNSIETASPPESSPPASLTNHDSLLQTKTAADGLWSASFVGLLVVQFCTALNDNAFRWLVVPIAKPIVGDSLALAVGLAGFTLPFLLCAAPAGYLADRFSKAKVITAFRFVEMLVFALGLAAITTLNATLLFVIVMATGALTALFSPAKLGSLPEMVRNSELSTANGWMGLMVVVPSAIGFLLGNIMVEWVQPEPGGPIVMYGLGLAAALLMSVAVIGYFASLLIHRHPAADPSRRWTWDFATDTWTSLRLLSDAKVLWRTALGIGFFWMLASLAQINIDAFGIHDLKLSQTDIGLLGMVLVLGLGIGSILAGVCSAGRIELGLVPVGAAGIALCSIALFLAGHEVTDSRTWPFYASCAALLGLGISAGLFDVPLEAYLQYRSPPDHLGSVIAATNFLVFGGILIVSLVFYILRDVLHLSPATIFLLAGIVTVPVGIYIMTLLPATMFRMIVWLAMHCMYRLRIVGRSNIPTEGGVLLVPNHVTWVDGLLLLITVPRPVRFIIYADYAESPRLKWLAEIFDIIPIRSNDGPKSLLRSLKLAQQALINGECVCIFAEGTLTRTGQLQPFQPGFLKILDKTQAQVVPVCLHGLWGSIFSYRGGKFFWKWPRAFRYPVTISFGVPMTDPRSPSEVSDRVRELGLQTVENNRFRELIPARKFLRICRQRGKQETMADSSGVSLSGQRLMAASLVLASVLRRSHLRPDEARVGILLPPTVACSLANFALTLLRRVTVNLNYTMSQTDLEYCVREAGLTHILTSRKMLEKKPVTLSAEWIFLEDLKAEATSWDKLRGGLSAFVLPLWWTEWRLGLSSVKPDDPLTVIFTSGSTGEPKGVVLSHHNITATTSAADQIYQLAKDDVVLGVIPIFHSLGYLTTLWLPVCVGTKVVYHTNPLDARQIGELAEKYKATILFGTPTFLRTYLKRCTTEQFASLDLVVVGAEKLPADLAQQFQDKYGVVPTEGYGATETTGPAAVNVPDHRCEMVEQKGTKLGTVGRPLPDVLIRAVDPDSREVRPCGQEGLLEIKGANVMLGYLNRPDKTASVIRDGWYNTGDMGLIDTEGFVHITGRLSRFSKIGGEMVPHLKIEECLLSIVETSDSDDQGGPLLAVTAVPDSKKGERLVVLHRKLPWNVQNVLAELAKKDLPNLWIPDAESFVEVAQIPILGTGKMDLKGIKKLAEEQFSPTVAS